MSITDPVKSHYLLVTLFILYGAIGTSGCASITKGSDDAIYVEIPNCTEKVECTASNKKGAWEFSAPGTVRFKKSDDVLHIECKDGDRVAKRSVTPTSSEMIWGNILFGGIIGGGVDASTDAHWETPESVNLYRHNCQGEPIG